jgi:hypothetical protein
MLFIKTYQSISTRCEVLCTTVQNMVKAFHDPENFAGSMERYNWKNFHQMSPCRSTFRHTSL